MNKSINTEATGLMEIPSYGWREGLQLTGTNLSRISALMERIPDHLSVFGLEFQSPPKLEELCKAAEFNPGNATFLDQVRVLAVFTQILGDWTGCLVDRVVALTDNVNTNMEHEKSFLQAKQGGHEPPVKRY